MPNNPFFWMILLEAAFFAKDDPFTLRQQPPIVGRWNLTVTGADAKYPSWLEVRQSGFRTLVGTYVGQFGSARPIGKIEFNKGEFRFTLPPQWERRTDDITFKGTLKDGVLQGETTDDKGKTIRFEGRRAPALKPSATVKWDKANDLFNGRDLTGWKPRSAGVKNGWVVRKGVLINAEPGNDLLTRQTFGDFKLQVEFRYPKGSNSGIYLRGRYEVQIEDNYGDEPDSHKIAGVYGFLTPRINAAKKPGEWQAMEITLVGREVTITLNGERVIDRQAIPGTTGGALDSHEAKPGPILLQGDHGSIEFRKITLTPAIAKARPRRSER
jgi:hypothetical protein